MAQPDRPLRADAARNRARVLEVAYDTFAAEGLSVPIDEIARRAGVGAGTVYRHFPTKEDSVPGGRRGPDPAHRRTTGARWWPARSRGQALFSFLRSMVLEWGATDRGLADALAGLGIDVETVMPEAEEDFLGCSVACCARRRRRALCDGDVDVRDVKAILVGCLAMQALQPRRCRPAHRGGPGRAAALASDLALALVEC